MILFRILFNLFGMATSLLWLPILFLSRHLFLVIIVVVAFIIYAQFKDATPPAQVTPAAMPVEQPRAQRQASQPSSGQVLVEAVRKRENGDSAFATDLYAQMTDPERAYYSQIFFWAMTNLPTGQSQPWVNGNTNGSFTPTKTFTNNSGSTCRNFAETLKVRSTEQSLSGIACVKADGSWCKLKPNATPACGLGGKRGFWDSIKEMF